MEFWVLGPYAAWTGMQNTLGQHWSEYGLVGNVQWRCWDVSCLPLKNFFKKLLTEKLVLKFLPRDASRHCEIYAVPESSLLRKQQKNSYLT